MAHRNICVTGVKNLEYIQCSHCRNKYGVNDKLKDAAGKQIRCKNCHETFEIVIHDDSHTSESQINSEPAVIEQPAKKKVDAQALTSMVLGVILICVSVGGYLFLNKPELFSTAKQAAPKPIIPHNLVNPMAAGPAISEQAKPSSTKRKNVAAQSAQALKICKGLSADYWVRTRLLATAKLDTNTYMALLNMNLEQAQEIRKLCKEKLLVAKLVEAARTNKKPQWIKSEIGARLQQDARSHAKDSQNLSP